MASFHHLSWISIERYHALLREKNMKDDIESPDDKKGDDKSYIFSIYIYTYQNKNQIHYQKYVMYIY